MSLGGQHSTFFDIEFDANPVGIVIGVGRHVEELLPNDVE